MYLIEKSIHLYKLDCILIGVGKEIFIQNNCIVADRYTIGNLISIKC